MGGAILNALFTQSPVGLHVLDTELRVVRVNTATRGMRGMAVEGLLGRHFAEVRVSVAKVWAREKQVTAHGWMRFPGPLDVSAVLRSPPAPTGCRSAPWVPCTTADLRRQAMSRTSRSSLRPKAFMT
ncbi:PAS domain-containing protein [Streptomyces sp. NPDC058231]|uniref:PAS domain-containing protein n=1 Tax=Streptomyces sp. NPDC058231 TaxID=3346392 RepID=UPI0036EC31DA